MSLRINGVGGSYSVPHVLSRIYKYVPFDLTMQIKVKSPTGKIEVKTADVKAKIKTAWVFITDKAAVHKPCNDYFYKLGKKTKKTLKDVLEEGDITLHCLWPKEGHTFQELPDANSAGRDIAIEPSLLVEDDTAKLACTLIHELAHVAGATTNTRDQNAIAAEAALKSCLCAAQFRDDALGLIQKIELRGSRTA